MLVIYVAAMATMNVIMVQRIKEKHFESATQIQWNMFIVNIVLPDKKHVLTHILPLC